jgi:excisionase family DNA binding protein
MEGEIMEAISIYDLKDLSTKLNLSVRTLREYIKRREITASKVGRSYYVSEPALQRFLKAKELS